MPDGVLRKSRGEVVSQQHHVGAFPCVVVAHHRYHPSLADERPYPGKLGLRKQLRFTLGNTEIACDRCRLRLRAERVGNRDSTEKPPVSRDQHLGRGVAVLTRQAVDIDSLPSKERPVAGDDLLASQGSDDAEARRVPELVRFDRCGLDDLAEARVAPEPLSPHLERAQLGDGASVDSDARSLLNRQSRYRKS